MTASNKFLDEEEKRKQEEEEQKQHDKLLDIFQQSDANKNGLITKDEWLAMLEDQSTMLELTEDTHLEKADLMDLYDCLSVEGDDGGSSGANNSEPGVVDYDLLIHSLKANSAVADKRAVQHVMLRLRIMQEQFKSGFDELKGMIKTQQQPGTLT